MPANFHVHDAVVAERAIPERDPYPNPVEFSWEYWFNYFYNEVSNDAPLYRKKEFFLRISPEEGRLLREAEIGDTTAKRRLLDDMMALGFERYVTREHLTAAKMFETMIAHQGLGGFDLQNKGIKVVFRGDSRLPQKIHENQGTRPQTVVQTQRIGCNFRELWHPWNDWEKANRVYYRKGNADNCLFSAISVTPEFLVATKFPLLQDLRAHHADQIGTADVVLKYRATAGDSQVTDLRKRLDPNQRTRHLACSRTNIYVVKVQGGWDTQAKQFAQHRGEFPERAFDSLSWDDHLACFRVVRVHFDENDANAGHLVVVESGEWLQPESDLQVYLGRGAYSELIRFVSKIKAEAQLQGGKGGIYYSPIGARPPFEIETINRFTWNAAAAPAAARAGQH
jgi:hypothetical protein